MRRIIKRYIHPFVYYWAKKYYAKPRKYRYKKIEVIVHPEVFPPHLTFSTKILLDYINPLPLESKTFLELGCGSGIISLLAASKGADVTASDINPIALEALEKAKQKSKLSLNIIHSDLFDNLPRETYDYILINPPYYPKTPENIAQHAWFCGSDFEYFQKLFKQLPDFISNNQVWMILSEDCNIDRIRKIGRENQLDLTLIFEKNGLVERNFIFRITN